jgi:hypothetical protein
METLDGSNTINLRLPSVSGEREVTPPNRASSHKLKIFPFSERSLRL